MALDIRDIFSNPPKETYVILVRLTHPTLAEDIRVCTNNEDILYQGEIWFGCQLLATLPTRNNNLRTAQISIQNVDSRIGEAARAINTPCKIYFSIIKGQAAEQQIDYPPLKMSNISADSIAVTGELINIRDPANPYPKIRATKSVAPGLYNDVLLEF